MIHHISIPARDPRHVATVLAELLAGYAGPFIGPLPGAWVVYSNDGHGTGIEVYPESTALAPGDGELPAAWVSPVAVAPVAFHALISVPIDRAAIEAIGARAGWRAQHFWRGPNPATRLFELYELWVENRVLLELVTPDMIPAYAAIANGAAQTELLARRGAPP